MVQSNEDIKRALYSLPQAFETLSKGQRTELRRVRNPEELRNIGGFYELCSIHPVLQGKLWHTRNVVFFLPWVEHTEEISLGGSLFRAEISERRIYQVIRSTYSNDLLYLWRLTQMTISRGKTKKLRVNWQDMSQALYYWGEDSKRKILSDFFKEEYFTKNKSEEKENNSDDKKN